MKKGHEDLTIVTNCWLTQHESTSSLTGWLYVVTIDVGSDVFSDLEAPEECLAATNLSLIHI